LPFIFNRIFSALGAKEVVEKVFVGAVRHLRCRREEWSSLHGFTLAPLGHHPRLSMVCPLWGQLEDVMGVSRWKLSLLCWLMQ